MPRVLPRSSEPCRDFFSHLPACMVALARGMAARHGDHQAEGELGDGDGVGAGGVHDDDAASGWRRRCRCCRRPRRRGR